VTPNKRFDTNPQQRRFAPLFRAGQSQRWASAMEAVSGSTRSRFTRSIPTAAHRQDKFRLRNVSGLGGDRLDLAQIRGQGEP
jgi:hypothetical protein